MRGRFSKRQMKTGIARDDEAFKIRELRCPSLASKARHRRKV